ncbi:hypothetical protein AVEN_143155-1 [Araneus ventricosus]|uniref:DDE Tnp4 domain-containing protein n=1 Tax=Araneus ventricosus TaxID=182803 RepID=A0A4Y2JS16_ARAVE|nr:hypothetical protein AVEN_143155-1 [Araneus ventricosus]
MGDKLSPNTLRNSALTPEEKLCIALSVFASWSHQQIIGDVNLISQVSCKFYETSGFPCVFGALDCTHIPIVSPGGSNAELFRNRKGFFPLNVQTLSDPDSHIRNIVARWPGSVHDSTIFEHSSLRAKFEAGVIPPKYHLVGDNGYGCSTYLLTQFLNPRTQSERNLFKLLLRAGSLYLCGILFNLSIDPTIRRIQGSAEDHKILAFADDICLLADSPAELQAQLNKVSEDLKRISLSLNLRKSFAFHLECNTPVGTRDSDFFLDNERLQTIQEFDSHKFLRVPVGYNPVSDLNDLSEIAELGIRLATSLLAPWQCIDALKCFFYPTMQFAMRTAQYEKKHFDAIDNAIRKEIKKTLYLPVTASNKFIY